MEDRYDIKILFIDDEEDVRDITKKIMQEYGYSNFETIESIEKAKETFENKHFDILIVDMRFDGEMRGFEVLKLGEDNNKLASNMIIFTANDDVLDCRKAFKLGAWDYIPKNMIDYNPHEQLHESIQDAIKHTDTWGNDKDSHWVNEHIDEIIDEYEGQYVSVMDNQIIAHASTKEALEEIIKEKNLPKVMPLIFKAI
ncbi:MAG: response regulator [Sulfurovum sp.]